MEKSKSTLSRVNKVAGAIILVGSNTTLDAIVSYKLGRLADDCTIHLKGLEKESAKLGNKFNEDRLVLENLDITEDKREQKVILLKNKYNTDITALQDLEVDITFPEFKLNQFMAHEDIKQVIKTINEAGKEISEVITIKKGRALVPIQFFAQMGDIIKEE